MTTHWPGWGKTPNARHPLDEKHPDIEWAIQERSSFNVKQGRKEVEYDWQVANRVTGHSLAGTASSCEPKWAMNDARRAVTNAAEYLLTHDLTWSKTDPCVICDQPSRVGTATCSHAHDLILEKVKKELSDVSEM